MSQFEIEIKTLLGEKENADKLRAQIAERGGEQVSQHKQLNHYFTIPNPENLSKSLGEKFAGDIPADKKDSFKKILEEGKSFSIRTREADGDVLLVIKASIGDDTSDNGVSRMEFEVALPFTLDQLDQKLIDAGLMYQAKWSREREEYKIDDMNICLDKNAGYGYLAEFESVINSQDEVDATKKKIYDLMKTMGVSELPQDRLERMFKFYNENWRDYYGTDKVFVIE